MITTVEFYSDDFTLERSVSLFEQLFRQQLNSAQKITGGEFPEILIAKCRSRFYCTWFFHGRKILKVDGRDGRDPQNREKHAPAGRFTCMKSSGGDTYTDQSCRETRSLHLPEWFLPWVVEKQGPIIFYKHLGFLCRITNCLIGTVVSHIEEFFQLGLLSDN